MNTDQRILQILENSACLSKGQLLGYIKHTLYPEELRAVELHLSTCAFCNDALEGLEQQQDSEKLLASLVPPVLPHVSPKEKPKEKKEAVPSVPKQEKPQTQAVAAKTLSQPLTGTQAVADNVQQLRPRSLWRRPLAVAAVLILGFGALWYFEFRKDDRQEQLAQQMPPAADTDQHTENRQMAAVPDTVAKNTKVIAEEKKHKDSLFLARREEAKRKARRDSAAQLLAVNSRRPQEEVQRLMDKQETEKESTAVVAADMTAKKALAAAPAAPRNKDKEDSKKEDSKESKKVLTDYEAGMQKYKEKNYASALLYFKSAESDKSDPKHWEAVYYSALCNKNLDKKRKAIKLFERVIDANAPQKKAAQKQLDELKKKDKE